MLDSQQLVAAIWSISEGRGSDDELALLRADQRASLTVLDRLIIETEADLAAVRTLSGEEREQVVADFTETLAGLRATEARLRPQPARRRPRCGVGGCVAGRSRHARDRGVPLDTR